MPKAPPASRTTASARSVTVPPGPAPTPSPSRSKGPAPAVAPGTRSVTVPQPEDFQHAEKDALLQLKIGRSAHVYAVFVSTALALNGLLLLFFYRQLPSFASSDHGMTALQDTFYLILPLIAGLAVAAVGLASKWEDFMLWPWEPHFSLTVTALAVNALLAVVYALRLDGVSVFATISLFPWFYAAELAGISLAFVAFALTWSGWSPRQWASTISAVVAVPTVLLVYFPPANTAGVSDAFAASLFISATLYQTSGSFLHLISSGTRPHERELITSGQTRMFRMADELRKREEALAFRESTLVQREAGVENSVRSIARQNDSLKEARAQLDGLEDDYRQRSDAVAAKEREWAGKVAEMDARGRLVDDKTKALELREQEVARLLPQISTREQRLVQREGEQAKREVELAQRDQALAPRETGVTESEARLEVRRRELDQKTQELLRREGDLTAREASTPAPGESVVAVSQDLAAREVKLKQLQSVLDEQNLQLGKRAREVSDRTKSVEEARKALADKEASLAAREATVRQRETDVADLETAARERRAQYESASKEYVSRLEEVGRQSAAAAERNADLDQRLKSSSDKDSALAAREARLKDRLAEIERREGELTHREASLRASEAEVSLRSQAMARGSDLSLTGLAAVAAAEGMDQPTAAHDRRAHAGRDRGIRDVAQEPAAPSDAAPAEMLSTARTRRFPDRLPTGTPRMDDLLLGGIPPRGHVVVLGDAMVGKEVLLYSFIAEGLKRGEPAVLLSASRSPNEVAQDLGVVLPQFREYEQMGMVRWIDASGSGAPPDDHRTVLASSDDRAGILSNLVQTANALDGAKSSAPFRVAFFGLAAVLAHGDERAAFQFLQNVVGILKPRNAIAMYSLEAGALSEAQVETLLGRMDGAILFRQDRDRLLLSVKGFGDVETRDWIECRVSARSLIVGSFALERIR